MKPNGLRHGVAVTAKWGWTNVPSAIKYATLVQAARLYDRRENVAGALRTKQIDDIRMDWSAAANQDLDPDVAASVAPYRRLWAAA